MIEGAQWLKWPAYRSTYISHVGAFVVQAAAHGATAGFWWLLNPVGSTSRLYMRRVDFVSQVGSVLLTPTSPRVTLERMTFTGGPPSGPTVTPATALSGAPAATGTIRTSTAGISPAGGAAFHAFLPVACMTAAGASPADPHIYDPDAPIELIAGEGIVCRQPDAGTGADTRRFAMTLYWSEFTP